MRFNYFTILVLINALVLPPEWPNIVKPTLFSLKETKLKLLTSLQSLMPQNIPDYNVSISSFQQLILSIIMVHNKTILIYKQIQILP